MSYNSIVANAFNDGRFQGFLEVIQELHPKDEWKTKYIEMLNKLCFNKDMIDYYVNYYFSDVNL